MDQGTTLMARPKSKAAPSRTVASAGGRIVIVHLKGSPEFAGWLEVVHKTTGIPKTEIFRRAVRVWAETHGHEPPPEI